MKENNDLYSFNVIGLFAVSVNRRVKFKHSFYCAEFVKYLLDRAKIKNELPSIVKPEDFKNLADTKIEYEGKLKEYSNKYIKKMNLLEEVS